MKNCIIVSNGNFSHIYHINVSPNTYFNSRTLCFNQSELACVGGRGSDSKPGYHAG